MHDSVIEVVARGIYRVYIYGMAVYIFPVENFFLSTLSSLSNAYGSYIAYPLFGGSRQGKQDSTLRDSYIYFPSVLLSSLRAISIRRMMFSFGGEDVFFSRRRKDEKEKRPCRSTTSKALSGNRTRDLCLTKTALSQLSYESTSS